MSDLRTRHAPADRSPEHRRRAWPPLLVVGVLSLGLGLAVGSVGLDLSYDAGGATDQDATHAEVQDLLGQWDEAMAVDDLDTLRALATPDAEVYGRPLAGIASEAAFDRWHAGSGPPALDGPISVAVDGNGVVFASQASVFGGEQDLTVFRIVRTDDGLRLAYTTTADEFG